MKGKVLTVSGTVRIARPFEIVRRHFSDVEHHARNRVHSGVEFSPMAASGDECRYRRRIRVLGIPIVDEVVLRRAADGSITEDFVAGGSAGMKLVSRFQADGPEATTAMVTVELPLHGLRRLAAPFLRLIALRRLAKGL